ncbi:MAG: peptidyl-prolyl cis-trans isomerase [Parasporobacterium sp.]|nr:peptidyl-prolyl cis-trans isomerase [Parasporobacterium sp.]
MRRNSAKLRIVICMAAVLLLMFLSGCTEIRVTRSLGNNTLLEINDTTCSMGTGVLALLEAKENYKDADDVLLWSRRIGETTLAEYIKDTVTDELLRYTSAEVMAQSLTVFISEEDRIRIETDAQALFDDLNSRYNLARYNITWEDAIDLLVKRTYYNKVYEKLSENISMEISEADTKAIEISYVFIPVEDGIETAERMRNEVRGGADFASVCSAYGYVPVVDLTETKGNLPAPVDAKAFALRDNEVSEIIETRDGYYIIFCMEDYKVAESIANKNRMIADARRDKFQEAYDEFARKSKMRFNTKAWDEYDLTVME